MKSSSSPLVLAFRILTGLLAVCLLCLVSNADAKVLKDKKTGLKVNAPKGYRLIAKNGVYKVTDGDAYVKFMRAYTPLSAKALAKQFKKKSKIKKSKLRKKGKKFVLNGKLKRKQVTIEFQPKGKYVDIVTFGRKKGRLLSQPLEPVTAMAIQSDPAAFATIADVLNQLRSIAASRRGGRVLPLPVNLPMRQFSAGGATALVPNLPGWTHDGAGGALSGGNPTQGTYGLGLFWPLNGFVPVNSEAAIFQAWPAISGNAVQVIAVARIPNTTGWLGANFDSAMYTVRFRLAGRTWQGLMVSGSTVIGSTFWWYQSYVAVPEGGPGGIAQALLNTWASWDPSSAATARLNQAIRTILTTVVPGNPIDPEVFDRTVEDFTDYIRS